MMRVMQFRFAASLSAALAAFSAAAADVTIADLAPKNAYAVIAVDDYTRMREAFDRTGFARLLAEPEFKTWMKGVLPEQQNSLRRSMEELGIDGEHLPEPAGMLGAAFWLDEVAASPMVAHGLIAVDMGDDADLLDELLESLIGRGEDKGFIRVIEEEFEGADLREIELLDVDEELFGDQLLAVPQRLFIARSDASFYFITDKDELGRVLDRAAGKGDEALRGEPALIDARRIVSPAQITLTVLGKPFMDGIARLLRSDAGQEAFGGAPPDLQPILDALGLSSIRALSYGLEFDADSAMALVRAALLTPHREGLLGLFDVQAGAFEPPAFVSADAADVRVFRLDFSGIIPLLNQVIAALPEEQRFQAQAMAGMVTATVGPVFQTIGPDVVMARTIHRPLNADSEKQIVAIRTQDQNAINTSLQQLGQMAGLTSRQFEGHTIWESPGATIGFASGYVMVSEREMVETALRQSVNAQAPRLADEERFKQAASVTTPGAVYYSYSDFRTTMELAAWQQENWERLLREQLRGFEFDDETINDWIEDEREAREDGLVATMPPVDVVTRHVGDIVTETHATDDGFLLRTFWLAPR